MTRVEDITPMQRRYQKAHRLMRGIWNTELVRNTTLHPVWIGDSDCFWYVRQGKSAKEFRLVDAAKASNECAFDHQQLADALGDASQQSIDAKNLPFRKIEFDLDRRLISFFALNTRWQFDRETGHCVAIENARSNQEVLSPDGKLLIFSKDFNLWLRNLETHEEQALTVDGEEDFVYGGAGIAWAHTMSGCGLQVLWSSDSQRIFTVQRDTRQVKALPVVQHVPKNGDIRPQIKHYKFAYPGEPHVETLRLLSIDVKTGRHCAADYTQIPTTRNNFGLVSGHQVWWNRDNRRIHFVHIDRYYKYVRVMVFDTETGSTRILFEETADTHINLALNTDEKPAFIALPESNELLWYSERTGWAHLYLYDLETGALKNSVTQGDWLVRQTLHFDAVRREVFVQTAGRYPERDPYYRDVVRINIDSGELIELISSDHDCVAINAKDMMSGFGGAAFLGANAVSGSGQYAVVTRSRADEVPVSLLLDRDGKSILELEIADLSELGEDWQWPEPVKLKAADGSTDIYGLVYRPSDFSPEKSYPVVSHLFNTPELPWVPKGSFTNETVGGFSYLDAASLAELGFIVVQIDGRGTPFRSKAFHDECYGWVESAGNIEDHIAGIKQLSERYPYIDCKRAGITSHPSGGSGTVQGLLHYPDFYKVGTAGCLHDSRLMSATMWGDMFEGREGPNSDRQYPEKLVENFQGKMLLMQGMLDTTAPPATAFRLIEALQKANKDFDMIMLPNMAHDFSGYLVRRAWDYLVEHLMGEEPPKEYRLSGVFGVE